MTSYVLVGTDPSKSETLHPGGVLTLSTSLVDYAGEHGHKLDIVDVSRSGFAKTPLVARLKSGLVHVISLFLLLIKEKRSGVIIFSGASASFLERSLMSLLCKAFSVPDLFVMVDGHFLAEGEKHGLRRWIISRLLRIPHALAASGKPWEKFYSRMGVPKTSIRLIHYWLPKSFVAVENAKPMPQSRPVHFVYLGWMVPAKGINEMLEAIADLQSRYDFHFSFLGDGPMLEPVRDQIVQNNWQKTVSLPGWQSQNQIRQMMSVADVFVLPSHAEGFPMSLIEALYMGMPAIVSDVGGVSDSLHDGVNGFLIAPKDVHSLAAAMRKYIEQPDLIPLHSKASMAIARENHDAARNCALYFQALQTAE